MKSPKTKKIFYKKTATAKSILLGQDPDISMVESDMDLGPLNPEQLIKDLPKLRAKYAFGKDIKDRGAEDFFSIPLYKASVIRDYARLPADFQRKAMRMYAEGCSDAEVMGVFGISVKAWNDWLITRPEFAEFVEIGNKRGQAWWERMARKYVIEASSKFNSSLWFMTMKNNYGYKDEKKVEHSGEVQHGFVLLPPQSDSTSQGQIERAQEHSVSKPLLPEGFDPNGPLDAEFHPRS